MSINEANISSNNGVSVIICCYNSSQRLPETVRHLTKQILTPGLGIEVVIVDNSSSDNTYQIALQLSEVEKNFPIKVIKEKKQGHMYARIAGACKAFYDILLFCDDDNWLDSKYVQGAFEIMKKNTDVGILGGKIEAHYETNPPFWFENFKYAYAVGTQGEEDGDISMRGYVWGAGMIIRKELWDNIGKMKLHSFISGRKGLTLGSGDDSEICLISLILGYKLWYSSSLCLIHFIPSNRLNWQYLIRLTKGFGASEISLSPLKKILSCKRNDNFCESSFSWKNELSKITKLLLLHPKKTLKGLIGKEGNPNVIWFIYYCSYALHLIRNRHKINNAFRINLNIIKPSLEKERLQQSN